MKKKQILVDLLSAAIRNVKPQIKRNCNINWSAIFSLAQAHQVETIIFPVLKKINQKQVPGNNLLDKWHQITIAKSLRQDSFLERISKVLSAFSNARIKVIALKGLVLRDLYPYPELRSMIDADLLVQKNDLDFAINLLQNLNFKQHGSYSSTTKHIEFVSCENIKIELHWALTNQGINFNSRSLEFSIWANPLPLKILGANSFSLCIEDNIIYLCLHMTEHFLYRGFGLRQLCDLVLLVESNNESIDWNLVLKKAKESGIERFLIVLFQTCNKLFNLNLNEIFPAISKEDERYLDEFIRSIFFSGAYGRVSQNLQISEGFRQSLVTDKKEQPKKFPGKLKYFTSFIFPSAQNLQFRFSKGHKYPFLYPIAWLERLIRGFFFMKIPYKELFRLLITVGSVNQKRSRLLEWLNLK